MTAGSVVTGEQTGDSSGRWTLVWFNCIAKIALMLTADTCWRCEMHPQMSRSVQSLSVWLIAKASEITMYLIAACNNHHHDHE